MLPTGPVQELALPRRSQRSQQRSWGARVRDGVVARLFSSLQRGELLEFQRRTALCCENLCFSCCFDLGAINSRKPSSLPGTLWDTYLSVVLHRNFEVDSCPTGISCLSGAFDLPVWSHPRQLGIDKPSASARVFPFPLPSILAGSCLLCPKSLSEGRGNLPSCPPAGQNTTGCSTYRRDDDNRSAWRTPVRKLLLIGCRTSNTIAHNRSL